MLDTYFAIVEGRKRAKYLEAKRVGAGIHDLARQDEQSLWDAHAEATARGADTPISAGDEPSLLDLKIEIARRMLSSCRQCARCCGTDRTSGETGECGVGAVSRIASEFVHIGEESELVPSHTVFFTGCTLACVYCQNWDIATAPDSGAVVQPAELATRIEERHASGVRNVNFVGGDPTPHLATILETLSFCEANVPVVWNSNMFLSREALDLLDGIVDVYLADFRYGNDACALELSGVSGYSAAVRRSLARADESAEVMIRHLVLPGHLTCCTEPVMSWTEENLQDVYFNLMFQYRPCHDAWGHPGLDRRLSQAECAEALRLASQHGIDAR